MRNKNLGKKVAASLLMGILATSIGGCGDGKKVDAGKDMGSGTYVYVPEYIALPSAENTYVSDVYAHENNLYYTVNEYSEDKQESTETIYYLNLVDANSEPQVYMNLTAEENEDGYMSYTNKRIITEDGSIISVGTKYSATEVTSEEEYENVRQDTFFYLTKTDKDEKEVFYIDITSYLTMDIENSYVQYAIESKNGYIFLSNGSSYIWIFDQEGNHLTDVKLDSNSQYGSYINAFGVMQDGRAAYIQNGNNGLVLHVYDDTKKDFSESYENLPGDCWNTGITPGIQEGVLLCGQSALYEYNPTNQEYNEITKWLDVDLNGDFVNGVFSLKDGNIAVYYSDWNVNENSVVLLRKTLASEVKQKESITLGCMNLSQSLQSAIVNFNKSNEQYKVVIKDYTASVDWNKDTAMDDYNTAMMQFQNDIAAGNGPDLFSASDLDVDMLAIKGVIEDLNPYMQNSQVINRSDLIEPVINAYTTNGILCAIPATFSIYTLTGRTSEVGEKSGWTLDEMIAFANQYPDSEIIVHSSNIAMLSYCVMFDFDSYLNWETGECKFNTDEFKKVLEFAKKYPNEDTLNYEVSEPKALRTHKALLSISSLAGPQDWQVTQKMFDEPVTAIGFPSNNSTGVLISGNDGICINASSKNKEAAWSFIESLFAGDDVNDRYGWGFSTKKSVYDAAMEKAMIPEYLKDQDGNVIMDENGNPQEISNSGYGFGDDITIDVYSVKQEEADAIWQIINQIDGTMKYNTQLMNIIEEEASPYFRDQKTVDEVIDIIQSRVQVYVNESR
ncbi:MAG TPA: extracellular solute-binding protein [Lachnospiraceae bacterium]|nr:extracellular solute-binding protein [Lachnospiraceae bacterium]